MKNVKKMISFTIIGFALIIIGIALTRTIKQPREFIEILPYMCMVIIGCFILGRNLGNLMVHFSLKDSPELSKSIEIERNDERNIMIYNKAKAKAFDIMTSYVNIAIIIALALIRSNIWIIILFSAYSLLSFFLKLLIIPQKVSVLNKIS